MGATWNPFPGMNPFLERSWGPVHTALIAFIWEEIGRQLPPDLIARPEERVTVRERESPVSLRTDVAVSEPWRAGAAPTWRPETEAAGGVAVSEPQIVWVDEQLRAAGLGG